MLDKVGAFLFFGGMKINVTRIPDEGLELDFTEKDGWLQEKLGRALGEKHRAEDPIKGHFSVFRTMNNVQVRGDMRLPIHATCDRCAKAYDYEIKVHADRLMAPLFDSDRQREHEKKLDVEVTADDLQFSYFKGDEIDIGDVIVEQAVLDQPMIYLCRKDCKGLCPQCGADLNENPCQCKAASLQESPFAALKDWGKKKKK